MALPEHRGWNPYFAGGLAGIVSILSVWISGKFFGASTTFVRSVGMLEGLVGPERVARMEYFIKETPKIDWQWLFVVGIMLGALVASKTSRTFFWKAVPDMWERRFGPSRWKRGTAAFLGGLVAMFGARLAFG